MPELDHPYIPPPATFGLSKIAGPVGVFIAIGQLIAGDTSLFTHAFIVLDDETVLEASPGGARIMPLKDRLGWVPIAWSWDIKLSALEARDIVAAARTLVGTKYSFLDYLSLGLLHLGLNRGWVQRRVQTSGHMICSQLVDEVYKRGGVHLFTDGRHSGDVTPGALANIMLDTRWYHDPGASDHTNV